MISALSAIAVLFGQLFSAGTYALVGLAGIFNIIILTEIGVKWSLGAYFVSAALTFVFGISEAGLVYVMFFGYYPIIKALLEKIRFRIAEYIAKFAIFNLAIIAAYAILISIFGLAALGFDSMTFVWITLGVGNIFFILYDICISKIATLYYHKYRKHIKRLIK